jgi:RND family efflux transporter MFP subunit
MNRFVSVVPWRRIAPALLLFATAFGCADREAQQNAKAQAEMLSDTTIPVTVVRPERRDVKETLEVSGSLDTLDFVQVGAKVGGRLVRVSVREGSRVRAGQIIAQVETTDLRLQVEQARAALQQALARRSEAELQLAMTPEQTEAAVRQAEAQLESARARLDQLRAGARTQEKEQAKARVNQSKAQLDKAKADLDRVRRLYEQEAVAKADLDAAQAAYDQALAVYQQAVEAYDLLVEGTRPEEIRQAEQAVRQAEEALRSARANKAMDGVRRRQLEQAEAAVTQARAALRLAEAGLADAAVVAPFDGYVSGKPAQVGQVVAPGTPIATIVGLEGVYFDAQVSETDIVRVKEGQRVAIRVDAVRDREFEGTVIALNPVGSELGRVFSVRVGISDPERILRPGMFARGEIELEVVPDSLVLPAEAILREGERTYVWVRKGADGVEKMEVQVEETGDSVVRVTGITEADEVVLDGKEKLLPESKIRVESAGQRK